MDSSRALDTADIVVVGGGIVGLCTAYELNKRGFDVVIVEQRFFAFGASGRNPGAVWQQVRRSGTELRLAQRGLARYAEYEDELGPTFELRRHGGLFYYENEQQRAVLDDYVADRAAAGLDVALLDAAAAQQHSSIVPDSAIGAVFCADDAQIDAQAFARALGAACMRRGVRVYENTAVLSTLRRGDAVIGVSTVRGELHAAGVVWATGAWASTLRTEGIDLPIRTARVGQLVTQPITYKPGAVLHGPRGVAECGALTDLASFDPQIFRAPSAAAGFSFDDTLAQNTEGALLLGNSIDGPGSLNPHISMTATHAMTGIAMQRGTDIGDLGVTGLWAGLVGQTVDHLPIVDLVDGIYVNVAHAFGVASGPVCAEILACLIVHEDSGFGAELAATRAGLQTKPSRTRAS